MNDQFAEQQPKKPTPAEYLRAWADKIEKNAPEDFSGFFVVIPPVGDAISSLLIDQENDVNTFFAVVKSKIDDAVEALNTKQRQKSQW
jgi:hypothetical protein